MPRRGTNDLHPAKWAWTSGARGTDLLVLLGLADYQDPREAPPWWVWPSASSLAKKTGLSRRAIFSALNRLESKSMIERRHSGTRSTHYRLVHEMHTNAFVCTKRTGVVHEVHSTSARGAHESPNELPNEFSFFLDRSNYEDRAPLEGELVKKKNTISDHEDEDKGGLPF